jgi:hypothetical protein
VKKNSRALPFLESGVKYLDLQAAAHYSSLSFWTIREFVISGNHTWSVVTYDQTISTRLIAICKRKGIPYTRTSRYFASVFPESAFYFNFPTRRSPEYTPEEIEIRTRRIMEVNRLGLNNLRRNANGNCK